MKFLIAAASTGLAAVPALAGLPLPEPIDVPEPGAVALLAIGAVTAAIVARRRK